MAVITRVTAVNVILILTRGRDAIVAGSTGTGYLRVINCICRHPDIRRMAVLADIAGLYMRESFAGGIGAIVTTHTIAGDIYMVKIRG